MKLWIPGSTIKFTNNLYDKGPSETIFELSRDSTALIEIWTQFLI